MINRAIHGQQVLELEDDDGEAGKAAEMAELELEDLKEPVRTNMRTEFTIFLTLTPTFLSLGDEEEEGCLESGKSWAKELNL